MDRLFHVTSSRNRESIRTYGLDWTRMADARGIAGSRAPEQEGCFVCLGEFEMEWFVDMNNTGGTVDVVDDLVEFEAVVSRWRRSVSSRSGLFETMESCEFNSSLISITSARKGSPSAAVSAARVS